MRLNFVNFRKVQSSADVCWSGSADQQCFKSAFLSATSYVVGGKQHVDGLLCLVQTASLLRVMCLGGGYHPSCHPVPRETCFPKGPRLLLSHSSSSVGCFCPDCLSGAMMAVQREQQVLSYTHGFLSVPLHSSSRNFHPSISDTCVKPAQHF